MSLQRICLWGLLLMPTAAAAATDCWTITDPDQRAYCRAVATNSVGQCTAISDFGLRQTCRARVGKNPSNCNSLTSSWEREQCQKQAEPSRK